MYGGLPYPDARRKHGEMSIRLGFQMDLSPSRSLQNHARSGIRWSLVNLIARTLACHPVAIEDVNGKEVGLELAREWTRSLAFGSLFGSWSVKVVNELDRCSKDAQDMLLTYLDRMKPGHAFLGTTNLDLGSLTERFQTRFQSVRLQPPENEVLAAFLARRWAAPIATTRMIAAGAAGNVRAAMADLEMWVG